MKTVKKILLMYFIFWLLIIVSFWLGLRLEPMLFSIIAFYLALPLSAFLVSIYLGTVRSHLKWLFVLFSGIMQFLAPFLTFNLANIFATSKVTLPDISSSIFSIIPSILGMVIGIKIKHKIDAKKAARTAQKEVLQENNEKTEEVQS